MKNLLYGTLFLALVGIIFVGCEKSDDETSNKTVKARSVYNDYELTFLEIKKIANLHNIFLEDFHRQNYSFNDYRMKKDSILLTYNDGNIKEYELLKWVKILRKLAGRLN